MTETTYTPIRPYHSAAEAERKLAEASHGDTAGYWRAVRRYSITPGAGK